MARKGLGSVLRRLNKDAEEGKSFSVVSEIDKACRAGIMDATAFSLGGIRKQLDVLQGLLAKDEFNRDEFFSQFHVLYALVMGPDRRAKGVFHPSQLLDGCLRQMAYDLSGEKPTDEVYRGISAEIQRTFNVGTWYHVYMQGILYKLGLLEAAEVPVENKEKYLNAKANSVFKEEVYGEKVVLEIKTMNDFIYKKAVFRPFAKHEFQASLYARELGAKKVLYLYINKNTSEIKEFLMPVNEEQLKVADKKMTTVIESLRTKTLPKRTCDDKMCDDAMACPFRTLCFGK